MTSWAVVVALAVLGVVVLGAIGWLVAEFDDHLTADDQAIPDLGPTDRLLTAADVPHLRFRLAFRGYRMSDVDAAMELLAASLLQHDHSLDELPVESADVVDSLEPVDKDAI